MAKVLLEVCVESVQDAATAVAGGADRLELNCALPLGGLTPSLATLTLIRQRLGEAVPIVAMVRPRGGGFRYTDGEFEVMRREVDLLLERGASGIATGILTDEGRVDRERCGILVKQVAAASAPEGVVFHRAFDFIPDPLGALEELADLGIGRVMTSGQRHTALDGSELIRKLVQRGAERIGVLPAGGIRPANVVQLVARTGCTQVHASLREPRPDLNRCLRHRAGLPLGGHAGAAHGGAEPPPGSTSPKMVAEMVALLRG